MAMTPPEFGLLPVRSPLLGQSRVDFFYLRLLRCFTSPRLASRPYGLRTGFRQMNGGGFPHSDISGLTPACGSPELIAACHVLHRRSKPRHPPVALRSLTTENFSARQCSCQRAHVTVLTHSFRAEGAAILSHAICSNAHDPQRINSLDLNRIEPLSPRPFGPRQSGRSPSRARR